MNACIHILFPFSKEEICWVFFPEDSDGLGQFLLPFYIFILIPKKKNEKGNLYTQFLHHNSNVVTMNLCKNDKQLHTI